MTKVLAVNRRKYVALELELLPSLASTSNQFRSDVVRRQDAPTEPSPVPFLVITFPERTTLSTLVNGLL